MRYITTEVVDGKIFYKVEKDLENKYFPTKQEAEDYLVELENQEYAITKVEHSSSGLKKVLFKELDMILEGKNDKARTREIIATVQSITNVAKLELEYAKFSKGDEKKEVLAIGM